MNEINKTSENLTKLWDKYAKAGYEKVYLTHSTRETRKRMEELFELQESGVVLDAGCGTGGLRGCN